jgi:hypothetical protein
MLRKQSQSSYFPHSQSFAEEDESQPNGRIAGVPARIYANEQERNEFNQQLETYQRISDVALLNHGIHFPKNAAVLWDREGLTAPRYVNCEQIVPPLVLTREDIRKLLKALLHPSSSSPSPSGLSSSEMMGSVLEIGQLSEAHQRALLSNPSSVLFSGGTTPFPNASLNSRGSYGFVLDQNSGRGPDTSMTIPLVKKDANDVAVTDLTFDQNNSE